MTAPNPPHVAASAGPINIQTPKQEATMEEVNDQDLTDLPAFK